MKKITKKSTKLPEFDKLSISSNYLSNTLRNEILSEITTHTKPPTPEQCTLEPRTQEQCTQELCALEQCALEQCALEPRTPEPPKIEKQIGMYFTQ